MEALVERPEIIELLVETLRERDARTRPVMADALLGVLGQIADQLGHQLALAAEVMVNVGGGDADRIGNVAEIEGIVADEHIVFARDLLDAVTRIAAAGSRFLLRFRRIHA